MRVRAEKIRLSVYALFAILLCFSASWLGFAALHSNEKFSWFDIWNHWDTGFYLNIVHNGYSRSGPNRSSIAFFPLYPWLIDLFNTVIRNPLWSALVVSNLCFLFSVHLLYDLSRMDLGPRGAFRSVLFMIAFPTAYFLHAGYSESLFLATSLASMLRARQERWVEASLFGALATASRLNGVALIPALLIEYATQKDFQWKRLDWRVLYPLLAGSGLLLYLSLNFYLFGNPLEFMKIQTTNWGRHLAWPHQGFLIAWSGFYWRSPYEKIMVAGAEVFAGIAGLILVLISFFRLRLSYSVFLLLGWLMLVCNSFWYSQPRILMGFFPVFLALSAVTPKKWVFEGALSLCLVVQTIFLLLFIQGSWAF